MKDVAPFEVIVHRAFWSMLVCLLLIVIFGQLGSLRQIIMTPQIIWRLALAGIFIVANWTTYVYAVQIGRTVDASLGYFINPLVTIAFGVIILRERITFLQQVAIALGVIAVGYLVISMGALPWISIILALSFALYSLVKKKVAKDVPALAGMVIENTAVMPFLLGYLIYLLWTNQSFMQRLPDPSNSLMIFALLIGSGIVTAVPLVLFAIASRELPLWILGFLQYISPIMQLLIGVFVFHENMPVERWIGSGIIWLALLCLSIDGIIITRKRRSTCKER
ncbi:chloramphenicol-sensitive protein RarD [Arcanobacterium hippocoleae]|uniref:Chloramphenicol-sensitive protein RarD n=1 Tax=Arcanobacterium hippocoleae TaxID=149017 RepID=A0ABU1T186_9ACTO|nr:chloramphenicol-sensitive protein RarD [Arcanobacterium hippocoleae]